MDLAFTYYLNSTFKRSFIYLCLCAGLCVRVRVQSFRFYFAIFAYLSDGCKSRCVTTIKFGTDHMLQISDMLPGLLPETSAVAK